MKSPKFLIFLFIAILIVGCGSEPEQTPTLTRAPLFEEVATATPTPAPTAEATQVPTVAAIQPVEYQSIVPGESLREAVEATPTGGVLQLRAGTYKLTECLFREEPITILGSTEGVTYVVADTGQCMLWFNGADATVSGITFQFLGLSSTAYDVIVMQDGELTLSDCALISGQTSLAQPSSGLSGLRVMGRGVATVTNCRIESHGYGILRSGILLQQEAELTLERSVISGNTIGILATDNSILKMFDGNNSSGNIFAGVIVERQARGFIVGNFLSYNPGIGLMVTGDAQVTVVNNIFSSNGKGIALCSSMTWEVSDDNQFYANSIEDLSSVCP